MMTTAKHDCEHVGDSLSVLLVGEHGAMHGIGRSTVAGHSAWNGKGRRCLRMTDDGLVC